MNLDNLYEALLSGDKTISDVSDIMKSPDMQKKLNAYLHRDLISSSIPFSIDELHEIEMILKITQFIYNNSGLDTGLSDTQYDGLYSIIIANDGADDTSAPIIPNGKNLTTHVYPALRGTLSKIYYLNNDPSETRTNPSRKSLYEWAASMQQKILQSTGEHVNLLNEEVYVFPKFDGVSAIFELDENGNILRVLTRGFTETNEAQDITIHFQHIQPRKHHEFGKVKYGLKTEIMMRNEDLDYYNLRYNKNYKNTRSIVSAILNSDTYDEEKSKLLRIIPLRVGSADGAQKLAAEVFDFPYIRCRLKDTDVIEKFAVSHKYVNDELRCDGAVMYIINERLQSILGRENNKNNYEVAYKFTEEVTFSKLVDIEYRLGLFGNVAPVAKIQPVVMKGNTIDSISLGSIGRVKKLQLRKGDKVKILYDIIPYLCFDEDCKHSDKKPFKIPENCPECGAKLESSETGVTLVCINPKCPCRQKGKILNYLNKMNIDNISYGIIDKLFDEGFVKDILDLYKIEKNAKKISKISGFGIVSVSSWIDEINSHKVVPDYVLLGSVGIEGISKKIFEKVMKQFDIDDLLDIVENKHVADLITVPGIKDKTAIKIMEGVKDNMYIIEKLRDILTVTGTKGRIDISKFSVAFTNIRDADKEQFVLSHGGTIDDNVTKKTTFLVVPNMATESGKVDKAKKYGVRIIPIDDMEAVISEYLSNL